MAPPVIGLLAIAVLLALIMFRMWIGVAMGLVGIIGLILLKGFNTTFVQLADVPFMNINSYTLTVVPMFTLMGMVIAESKIGSGLFGACNAWLGKRRGGLASATVVTSGLLGAITGSHLVGTVILSKVALPEMKRYKYEEGFASAAVAVGAPLSIIIPPSLPLIIYGIITEQPISKLFISGIIPGVIMILVFIGLIVVMCTRKPQMAPRADIKLKLKEKLNATWGVLPVIVLFIVVIGGVYAGIFTTTESGAIGSVGAILISISYKAISGKKFLQAIKETAMTLGMLFTMLMGTYIFIRFMTFSQLPQAISTFLVGLGAPLPVMMLALAILFILLGMFMPEIPMIILTVPVLFPGLHAIGFDPIWLGMFLVLMMALGAITPPIGMIVFLVSGLSDVPVPKLFKSVAPFIIGDLIVILLICIFPVLVTWLPSLMK
jgi:tripartite ATP-independent transporter DctM subunit